MAYTVALVLAEGVDGMIDASATRKPLIPCAQALRADNGGSLGAHPSGPYIVEIYAHRSAEIVDIVG
jgi:hypothetical protein